MVSQQARFVFRVDASLQIGTGHVMRCLTLAGSLRKAGAQCQFISRDHTGNLFALLNAQGFEWIALPAGNSDFQPRDDAQSPLPVHARWLGCDWETDAEQTREALQSDPPDWLVVDHYGLDSRWEQALRGDCQRIMVIDDLSDRPHDCDLLLDQNLGSSANTYGSLVPEHCTLLVGPTYALLRPEFAAAREHSLKRRQQPRLNQLLISMGGVDQHNATGAVLEAIQNSPLPQDCQITVVMGSQAPWLEKVSRLADKLPWQTEVVIDEKHMARLMGDSDLAIGAAGATSWERCCMGLPVLMVCLAANQVNAANCLVEAGAGWLVPLDENLPVRMEEAMTRISDNVSCLRDMSNSAAQVTDGKGTQRVLKALMKG